MWYPHGFYYNISMAVSHLAILANRSLQIAWYILWSLEAISTMPFHKSSVSISDLLCVCQMNMNVWTEIMRYSAVNVNEQNFAYEIHTCH